MVINTPQQLNVAQWLLSDQLIINAMMIEVNRADTRYNAAYVIGRLFRHVGLTHCQYGEIGIKAIRCAVSQLPQR